MHQSTPSTHRQSERRLEACIVPAVTIPPEHPKSTNQCSAKCSTASQAGESGQPYGTAPLTRPLIEAAVSQVFGVAYSDLRKSTRGRAPVALARQVAMYLAHVADGRTLTDVGKLFSRDRTTVSHACAVVEDRRDDPSFDYALELLERIIHALAAQRTMSGPATQ